MHTHVLPYSRTLTQIVGSGLSEPATCSLSQNVAHRIVFVATSSLGKGGGHTQRRICCLRIEDVHAALKRGIQQDFFRADQTDSSRDLVTVFCAVHTGSSSDIYRADTGGHHKKVFSIESSWPLLGLYWYVSKRQLVSVSRTGELCLHGQDEGQERWQQLVRLKIGGGAAPDGPALMVAWVGGHTLASATGRDDAVRMYDLDTEDNYILHVGKVHCEAPCATSSV